MACEVIGNPTTQEQALGCLKTGGRMVCVGYGPKPMTLNSGRVMFRKLEVVGSLGCRPVDYPRVVETCRGLHRAGAAGDASLRARPDGRGAGYASGWLGHRVVITL